MRLNKRRRFVQHLLRDHLPRELRQLDLQTKENNLINWPVRFARLHIDKHIFGPARKLLWMAILIAVGIQEHIVERQ